MFDRPGLAFLFLIGEVPRGVAVNACLPTQYSELYVRQNGSINCVQKGPGHAWQVFVAIYTRSSKSNRVLHMAVFLLFFFSVLDDMDGVLRMWSNRQRIRLVLAANNSLFMAICAR